MSRQMRLMPLFLILLFVLFILVLLLVVIGIFLVVFFVFLFVLRRFEFERIQAGHAEIGTALFTGQWIAFVEFFLIQVKQRVAVRTIDHLHFLQKHRFHYSRIQSRSVMFSPLPASAA